MKKEPLLRALRVDKMTIAALEATLRLYLKPELAMTQIPTLQMLRRSQKFLQQQAQGLASSLGALFGVSSDYIRGFSQVGGGAYPTNQLPTYLVTVTHDNYSASELEEKLRLSDSHIISRVSPDTVQFDVRTLSQCDTEKIVEEMSLLS